MATETTERVQFSVYVIETDNFDGRLRRELSFERHDGECTHNRNAMGFVVSDTLDGGLAGHLTAPAGSRLVLTDMADLVLELPDGTNLNAEECYRAARSADRAQSFGLGWSPAR
jgi:hypothetical protein